MDVVCAQTRVSADENIHFLNTCVPMRTAMYLCDYVNVTVCFALAPLTSITYTVTK